MILKIFLLFCIIQHCWTFPAEVNENEKKDKSETSLSKEIEKSRDSKQLPNEVVISSEPMNFKSNGQSPVTYVKIDEDGIPIIEGVRVHDDDDGLIYRNAKVINGKLFTLQNKPKKKQARILSLGNSKPETSRQDISNFIPQYVDTASPHQFSGSFPYYSANPSSASLVGSGSPFQGQPQSPFGQFVPESSFGNPGGQFGAGEYFPLEHIRQSEDDEDSGVFRRMVNSFLRGQTRMRDFLSPIVDPFIEMGQRFTDSLGLTNSLEKALNNVPDGVTRQDAAGTAALSALGMVAAIAAIPVVGYVSQTFNSNRTVEFVQNATQDLKTAVGNLGKRSVDDQQFLDGIEDSQVSLLGRLHSAWRSSPCAKRLLCHLMAMTPEDVLDTIEKRVLNMMFRFGIHKKHYAALREEMDYALLRGNCNLIQCTEDDVSVDALLQPLSLVNTKVAGPKSFLVPPAA